MIYLKKPDGTIQQIETEDEQQMRQALNIDKQLAAQKGEEFGEVYMWKMVLQNLYKVKHYILGQYLSVRYQKRNTRKRYL